VPAGTVLTGCTYGGDVLTFMQARAMRPETKDYVMALHFNVHVDAAMHPGYLARYINDNLADGGRHRNVRFVKDACRTMRIGRHNAGSQGGRGAVRGVRRRVLAAQGRSGGRRRGVMKQRIDKLLNNECR
jgi:hypothetical protein